MFTLGAKASLVGHAVFTGRSAELTRIAPVLEGTSDRSIVFLHGPGGIGKTALLREILHRAAEAGRTPVRITASELVAGDSLVGLLPPEPRLVLGIDEWERLGGTGVAVRDDLLSRLPEDAVVVIAGRQPPDLVWWGDGWERLILEVPLLPLDQDTSTGLLRAHGVSEDAADAIAGWAGGSPLALVLAAALGDQWQRDAAPAGELIARLARRLIDVALEPGQFDVLAAAAVARSTTAAVLAAALPGTDAESAYRWLTSQSFVERLAAGVTLHDLVRRVVIEAIDTDRPDLLRDIRRRLADHFSAEALRQRTPVHPDLSYLLTDATLRWGIGWQDTWVYRCDHVRPGDEAALRERIGGTPGAEDWSSIQRYLREAPEHVGIVRGADGTIWGYMIATTPRAASPVALEDPEFSAWIAHALRADPTGNAVLWRTSSTLTKDPAAPIQSLLGWAGISRSGLANPRYCYLPIATDEPEAVRFADALSAHRVPELDRMVGGHEVQCRVVDLGDGGIVNAQRQAIYRELGLAAPGGLSTGPGAWDVRDAVREAVRHWHTPDHLASNPLASGDSVTARADTVRRRIEAAAAVTFDQSAGDRSLAEVLVSACARPASHTATAQALHMSRAVYFRRLRTATERVAEHLTL